MVLGSNKIRKQINSRTFFREIFNERNMIRTERFLSGIIKNHGKHPVSTDGGT